MATSYENIYAKQKSSSTASIVQNNVEDCRLISKCCFCISLKTGCYTLGYISLALNFVLTVFFLGTLAFLAIYTHGFRYIHMKYNNEGLKIPDVDSIDSFKLHWILVVTLFVGCLNITWFVMNVILLVGLHRKRPGHVKLHVSVATIRIVLSTVGMFLYKAHTVNSFIICSLEIGLSAYFIFLYYRYTNHLKQEFRSTNTEIRPVSKIVANVVTQCREMIDQTTLTEKGDKFFNA